MKNNMFGITNIKVEFFSCSKGEELNRFLKVHDGNIIDIQYQQNNFNAKQVMVIYKEM